MQTFRDIQDTDTLRDSRAYLMNNIKTVMSQWSGTTFPTANLQLGMPCFRTDLNKLYVLKSIDPVDAWQEVMDFSKTQAYLESPAFSGVPSAPTAAAGTNTTQLATTAFVMAGLGLKLNASVYTAADVLTKIKTVDGSGSGLDADLLDGLDSKAFLRSNANNSFGNRLTVATGRNGLFEDNSSSLPRGIEVVADNGNDAMMTFHVSGDYAVHFGLDASVNDLAVGGWSKGANAYRILHEGNMSELGVGGGGLTPPTAGSTYTIWRQYPAPQTLNTTVNPRFRILVGGVLRISAILRAWAEDDPGQYIYPGPTTTYLDIYLNGVVVATKSVYSSTGSTVTTTVTQDLTVGGGDEIYFKRRIVPQQNAIGRGDVRDLQFLSGSEAYGCVVKD